MLHRPTVAKVLGLACLLAGAWLFLGVGPAERLGAAPQDKKEVKEKDGKKAKRGGTVTGVVSKKDKNAIEVKADGEERARRYMPNWVGGLPAKGGGFDKKILKAIDALKVGDRVRLEWEFHERPRVIRIDLLKAGAGEKK